MKVLGVIGDVTKLLTEKRNQAELAWLSFSLVADHYVPSGWDNFANRLKHCIGFVPKYPEQYTTSVDCYPVSHTAMFEDGSVVIVVYDEKVEFTDYKKLGWHIFYSDRMRARGKIV